MIVSTEIGTPAVLLVGHGSLRAGAGSAMIRLAEQVRAGKLAPIARAGFLNYSRPTFGEALARCVKDGAADIVVQPYFLVDGWFVREGVARLLEAERPVYPAVKLRMARAFGDHPALARLLLQRALEADYLAANPHIDTLGVPRPIDDGAGWRPLHTLHPTGLLIMAHGSPDARSNAPIYRVARRVRASGRYAAVTVCFMELNTPSIADAIDNMIRRGIRHMIAAPYFLHMGNHTAEDLPAIVAAARARHPDSTIIMADHLSYDRLLLAVIADRVAETVG